MDDSVDIRVGNGYDLHRLAKRAPHGYGRPLILAGVPIDHPLGPVGHSDGDAVLHAVTDALLGAVAAPDLGSLFPDHDPAWAGADSAAFVAEAVRRVEAAGYRVGNVDVTVICERPKIGPHRSAMRERLGDLLGVAMDRVNIKGKTHERLGELGAGHAIEVHAVAVVVRRDASPVA